MDLENMEVDLEEFQRQYRENAEKEGLVFKVYIENIDEKSFFGEEHKKGGSFCTPSVSIEGKGTPIMLATMINTCERTFDDLRKDEDIRMAEAFLRLATRNGKSVQVKKTEGEKND